MKVQLVALTSPLIRTEDNTRNLNVEEFIVYCARVSNPSNQLNTESAPRLLEYCIKHEHWSIFEQASLTFEIQTSRDISAQIIRHKSFSFQEFSLRYSATNALESFDIRKQAEKNRQSSSSLLELSVEETKEIVSHLNSSIQLYNNLISKGAAKECARKVLPLCTQTTLYMTGTLRSWIHYLSLRCKEDTQLEHREIANAIKKIFVEILPTTSDALKWTFSEIQENNLDSITELDETQNTKTWGKRSLSSIQEKKEKEMFEKMKEEKIKEFKEKNPGKTVFYL
jgi:thymidylate synthase (FAD)